MKKNALSAEDVRQMSEQILREQLNIQVSGYKCRSAMLCNVLPVWAGELAKQIKAELRRCHGSIRGRATGANTYKFTGLLVCEECGRKLSISLSNSKTRKFSAYYWVCPS